MKNLLKQSGFGLGLLALMYFATVMFFDLVQTKISEKDRFANHQGLESGMSETQHSKPRTVNMKSAWTMESGQML